MPHQCTDCGRGFADGSKEMLSGCPNCGGTTFQFQPDGVDEETTDQSVEPPEPPESEVDSTVARTVGSAATAVRDFVGGSSGGSASGHDGAGSSRKSTPRSEQNPSTATDLSPEDPSFSSGDPTEDTASGESLGESSSGDSIPNPSSASGESRSKSPGQDTTPSGTESRPQSNPSQTDPSASSGITADTKSHEDAAQASARSDVIEPDDLPPTPDVSVEERQTADASVEERQAAEDEQSKTEAKNDPELKELREQLNEQFESIRVLAPGQYELNLMELYDREEYIIALQEDGKYTIQVPERWGD